MREFWFVWYSDDLHQLFSSKEEAESKRSPGGIILQFNDGKKEKYLQSFFDNIGNRLEYLPDFVVRFHSFIQKKTN